MKLIILVLAIFISVSAQENVVAKANIAVLNLDAIDITAQEAQILTKKLSSELVKQGKYNVLDRGEMESILQEQGFQQSGCTSSECAVEVGQLLGVQKMIAGSVGKLGSIFYVEVRMIDVSSSKIEKSVDHNQEGSIEKVLTISLPFIAATLSDIKVSEPTKASNDSTMFIDIQSQNSVVPKVPLVSVPPVVPVVPVVPQKAKEITLKSHHNKAEIYLNGASIGKDMITIPVEKGTVVLFEKKRSYTSKPDTVDLSKKKGKVVGVGGNAKEAVLSAGYFSGRNGESIFPSLRLSAGLLLQSANTHEISLIFGGIDGFGMFSEAPSSSMNEKNVRVAVGGFYEWCYDIEIGQVLKFGAGLQSGFFMAREQEFKRFKYLETFSPIAIETIFMNDTKYTSFGGPKVRTAIGYKKVFLETGLSLQMGIQDISIKRADLRKTEWIDMNNAKTPFSSVEPGRSFMAMPMLSFNLLLTL